MRLRAPPQTQTERDPGSHTAEETPRTPGLVLCRNCSSHITGTDAASTHGGAHLHHLTNPAGQSFDVGLYSEAPGCADAGAPSTEASWFPPATWSFANCRGCGEQLGWVFATGTTAFVGLILARIRIEASPTRH